MEADVLSSLIIFLSGALIGCGMFAALFVRRVRGWVFSGLDLRFGRSARREAEDALSQLQGEIEVFKQNLAILDSYSAEYFHSFQEAGWHSLTRVSEDLSALEASLRVFMRTKRYDEVRDVSLLLLEKLSVERYEAVIVQHPVLSDLVGWRPRTGQALLKLIDIVTTSAQRTKDLGVERRRMRKPTLLSLAELRESLRQ